MVRAVAALGLMVVLIVASFAAAQSAEEPITITGDGITFTIDKVSYFGSFDGEDAEEGLLMLIEARLLADEDRCIHGYDFALMLDGVKYEASTRWMDRLKSFAGDIDYPGWGFIGLCFDADEEAPTFLVFDIPADNEEVELRFFEGTYLFDEWLPATALPTVTPTNTATRTPTKTPTPRPTGTPGMNDATRIAQSSDTGLTEAWEAVDGVVSVGMTYAADGEVFGEVCVENGRVNEETALALYQESVRFFTDATIWFSVIIGDENEAADFRFDTEDDEWVVTPLSGTACETSSATESDVAEDHTATGNANVRSCPQTSCDIVAGLVLGQRVVKVGEAQGASVNGSALWYEVSLSDGSTGYVHSGLLRYSTPQPVPVVVQPGNALVAATQPAGAPTDQQAGLPESFTSTPQPGSQYTCAGDLYNCSDFRNRTELMAYFNACPGDPSKLDGNNDGVPCESLR